MKYKITIPKPCHEDWSKMTTTQKGKFCNSCKKEVVDFTNLSTVEISKRISEEENLCGRFRKVQINKDINTSSNSVMHKVAASIVLASSIFATEPIFAQEKKDTIEVLNLKKGKFLVKKDSLTKFITIKGKVRDEIGGLPGASILLKGTHNGAQTDFDGNFSIKIPNKKGNSPILVISYLGYNTQEVKIKFINKPLVVVLEESITGEITTVTVGMIAVKKRPNIFKRIGNLFRKKENRKY